MKKIVLFIVLTSFGIAGFSTTFTISNSGNSFTPDAITINLGDDVNFSLESIHNAREVSLATWTANGNTALSGGFTVGFGGGTVSASKLTTGIHYYVCTPHASLGMKGTITVVNTTGITENSVNENITIYPNPSNGNFHLQINTSLAAKKMDVGIYDFQGKRIYSKTDVHRQTSSNVEISDLPKGIYFLRLNNGKETFYRKIVVQ